MLGGPGGDESAVFSPFSYLWSSRHSPPPTTVCGPLLSAADPKASSAVERTSRGSTPFRARRRAGGVRSAAPRLVRRFLRRVVVRSREPQQPELEEVVVEVVEVERAAAPELGAVHAEAGRRTCPIRPSTPTATSRSGQQAVAASAAAERMAERTARPPRPPSPAVAATGSAGGTDTNGTGTGARTRAAPSSRRPPRRAATHPRARSAGSTVRTARSSRTPR